MQDSGNDASSPAVNILFAKTTAAPTTETTEPAKQERLVKLKEALTIYQTNLSSDQIASLVQLFEEYSDIFALDAVMLLTLICVFSVVILIIRINHVIKRESIVSEESKSIHLVNKVIHHYIGDEDLKLYSFKVDGVKT